MNLQVHETVENFLPSWVPSGQGYRAMCSALFISILAWPVDSDLKGQHHRVHIDSDRTINSIRKYVAARKRNGLLPDLCEQHMEGFKHRPFFRRHANHCTAEYQKETSPRYCCQLGGKLLYRRFRLSIRLTIVYDRNA